MILLASSSPRRSALLASAGLRFRLFRPHIDESPRAGEKPLALVRRLAAEKARAARDEQRKRRCHVVLAADTIVTRRGRILNKPADARDAAQMLTALSGAPHEVMTGFAVWFLGEDRPKVNVVTTQVCFRRLSPADIRRYVESGEGADKAGAYAIQGIGAGLVDWVKGSYTNVIGLPVAEVLAALSR